MPTISCGAEFTLTGKWWNKRKKKKAEKYDIRQEKKEKDHEGIQYLSYTRYILAC